MIYTKLKDGENSSAKELRRLIGRLAKEQISIRISSPVHTSGAGM
jgi:hypothetical protein